MAEVIVLAEHRARRGTGTRARTPQATFHFDLSCPFSYLAAERVERLLPRAAWVPASSAALLRADPWSDPAQSAAAWSAAAARAAELRLPLVTLERPPAGAPQAMRAAAYAAERGRGSRFTLAAARLAFCGGYDLDDPEVLAEAAAAADLGLDDVLQAAGDLRRDGAIEAAGRKLLAAGATGLPVLRIGGTLHDGEPAVEAAAVSWRSGRRVAV